MGSSRPSGKRRLTLSRGRRRGFILSHSAKLMLSPKNQKVPSWLMMYVNLFLFGFSSSKNSPVIYFRCRWASEKLLHVSPLSLRPSSRHGNSGQENPRNRLRPQKHWTNHTFLRVISLAPFGACQKCVRNMLHHRRVKGKRPRSRTSSLQNTRVLVESRQTAVPLWLSVPFLPSPIGKISSGNTGRARSRLLVGTGAPLRIRWRAGVTRTAIPFESTSITETRGNPTLCSLPTSMR